MVGQRNQRINIRTSTKFQVSFKLRITWLHLSFSLQRARLDHRFITTTRASFATAGPCLRCAFFNLLKLLTTMLAQASWQCNNSMSGLKAGLKLHLSRLLTRLKLIFKSGNDHVLGNATWIPNAKPSIRGLSLAWCIQPSHLLHEARPPLQLYAHIFGIPCIQVVNYPLTLLRSGFTSLRLLLPLTNATLFIQKDWYPCWAQRLQVDWRRRNQQSNFK